MTELTLLTRLTRLKKLYTDRRAWTKNFFKTRKANHTCYCMVGGLNKVAGRPLLKTVPDDELRALGFKNEDEIFQWNDSTNRRVKDVQERVAFGLKNARRMARGLAPLPPAT